MLVSFACFVSRSDSFYCVAFVCAVLNGVVVLVVVFCWELFARVLYMFSF